MLNIKSCFPVGHTEFEKPIGSPSVGVLSKTGDPPGQDVNGEGTWGRRRRRSGTGRGGSSKEDQQRKTPEVA